MRITCPLCGERDRGEFTYQGAAVALFRPDPGAGAEIWDGYLHIRDNPAGDTQDLWYHDPCGAWIRVDRNTVTHAVTKSTLAAEVKR
jgi:sarcosine oxidase subunit delta